MFYAFKVTQNVKEVTDNKDMRCITEEFEIKGDYDSSTARNLMVIFDVCDSSLRQCKSQD